MLTQPQFFKSANNTDGAAEFKRCLPVNVNTSYNTLAPAIATAEQHHVKPLLGDTLFEEMAAYYSEYGIAGSSTEKNELIALIQMAVVRLAYWDSFDELSVMMSDRGISVVDDERRAYRYQADALRQTLQRQGFNYLNQAIGYIVDNLTTFASFESSDYYTERNDSVIRSLKEYENILSLNGDFFLFRRLRQYIGETEKMELTFRVGSTLADALRTSRDETRIETLLRSAQGFVAHWSMAEAVPFLNIIMTPQGPVVVSEESSGSSSGKVDNAPRGEQLEQLQRKHREMAERYIGQLVTYCKANWDTYPEISEIGIDTDHEKTALMRNNRNKKTFLA